MLSLRGTQFVRGSHPWKTALQQGSAWEVDINAAMRKYCIGSTRERTAHFLSQVMEESGWLTAVREYRGEERGYSPYYGRGLIQLTKVSNYEKYGKFKRFATTSISPAKYSDLGWNPDVLLANTNKDFDRHNCADSAGLYWTCGAMTAIGVNTLRTTDAGGLVVDTVIQASRSTNGNVANQNINGLEHRLQSFVHIKYVLLDLIESASPEQLSFVWRRNSAPEPVLDASDSPVLDPHTRRPKKKYFPATHNIQVSLEKQRP
jgi:predicted chitinase